MITHFSAHAAFVGLSRRFELMLEAAVCENDIAAADDVLDGEFLCVESGSEALDELLHTFFAFIGTAGLTWFTLAFANDVFAPRESCW